MLARLKTLACGFGVSPNMFSLTTAYPEFGYDHRGGCIWSVVHNTAAADVKREIDNIKSSIRKYNDSIASENETPRSTVVSVKWWKSNDVITG